MKSWEILGFLRHAMSCKYVSVCDLWNIIKMLGNKCGASAEIAVEMPIFFRLCYKTAPREREPWCFLSEQQAHRMLSFRLHCTRCSECNAVKTRTNTKLFALLLEVVSSHISFSLSGMIHVSLFSACLFWDSRVLANHYTHGCVR